MKESSDKNKPQKLEDLFRQTLGEAEVTPPDQVWERVAQSLDSKEAGYYKERVVWYRSLAAACLFLVVCAAAYLFYDLNYSHNNGSLIAQQPVAPPPAPTTRNAPLPTENSSDPALVQAPQVGQETTNIPAATERNQINMAVRSGKAAGYALNQTRAAKNNNQPESSFTDATIPATSRDTYAAVAGEPLNNFRPITPGGKAGEVAGAADESGGLKSVAPGLLSGFSKAAVWPEMRALPEKTNINLNTVAFLPEPAVDPKEKTRTARWTFNAKYAPQYFNQNIQLAAQSTPRLTNNSSVGVAGFSAPRASNVASSSYTQALQEYDNNTNAGFSYNTAVAAGYIINKHWSLESGLTFTQNIANSSSSFIFNNTNLAARYNFSPQSSNQIDTKQNSDPISILPATALLATLSGQQNINTATVVQTPAFDTQFRYRLIGLPVRLNYQTSQQKSFYFASVGFLTNMLVQAHVLSGSAKVPDLKYQGQADSPFRTWQVAATVSAGKGFRISKAVNLRAGIEGTQNLSSLAANPENLPNGKGKPYTIGVAFSSSYTLGL